MNYEEMQQQIAENLKNAEPLAVVEYFDTKTNSEEQEEFSAVSEAFERADDLCEFEHITNIQVISYIQKRPPTHKWTRYFITK